MESNFQKVIEFNKKFGVTVHDKPVPDIFDRDPKLVHLRMELIREEMRELEEAVKKKNYIETIDALCDILYVVYGAGCSFGADLDVAFDLVHKSNMSKLCRTEEEAKETVRYYEENKEKLGYDSPCYRLSDNKEINNKYYIVYNKSTGKILKSINYHPVDLTYLVK